MEQINGYEGLYEIHLNGSRVWSVRNKMYLKPRPCRIGYLYVNLKHNSSKTVKIHRLIAEYFINNPNNYPCVDHIDGDKQNNDIQNLRWVTYEQNNINKKTTKGYCWDKSMYCWKASIKINKKSIHLGYYNTKEEAREAYLVASEKYYPGIKKTYY